MTQDQAARPALRTTFDDIASQAPAALDLTRREHLDRTVLAADRILAHRPRVAELQRLEIETTIDADRAPLLAHLAVKLALSKASLAALRPPVKLSVVFAMYKEHRRILTQQEHPHGEDFLRRKVAQLGWLTHDMPGVSWHMVAVDDGCPEGSGDAAAQIVREEGLGAHVQVLWLEEAIRHGDVVTRPMSSTADSQKGGSILYGVSRASEDLSPHHVVLFTDADLSTHLGQAGRLAYEVLEGGADAAIGSRREATSVVLKTGTRNTRGKLFIYLWKRLLPVLGDVVDTQCGFKGFRADTAQRIVHDTLEKGFAFDIEQLLKVELARPGSITRVPIAWIDSESASTTTELEPYLAMLKSTAALYRRYVPPEPDAETFARLIDRLDEARWQRLVASMPEAITNADPQTFSAYDEITAAELSALAGLPVAD